MPETTTDRGRYTFRVAEYTDQTFWIMTDPLNDTDRLEILGNHSFLGFDLKPGTTKDQAWEIARYLDEHIEFITCTTFAR